MDIHICISRRKVNTKKEVKEREEEWKKLRWHTLGADLGWQNIKASEIRYKRAIVFFVRLTY